MSLRGRYIIDRIKRYTSNRLKLPAPPYHEPSYWNGVYEKLGPGDSFEWGDFNLKDHLLEHRYDAVMYKDEGTKYGFQRRGVEEGEEKDGFVTTTFGEAIGVYPDDNDDDDGTTNPKEENEEKTITTTQSQTIMLLGCGNSRMGEELLQNSYASTNRQKIVQVDISPHLISTMTQRCKPYIQSNSMDIIQDDATSLQQFKDDSVDAVIDKGLVDALFCADQYKQVLGVLQSVGRVLKVGGVLNVFSFSRPEFLLGRTLSEIDKEVEKAAKMQEKQHEEVVKMWSDLQIRVLDHIIMYRFVKASPSSSLLSRDDKIKEDEKRVVSVSRFQKQKQQRRRGRSGKKK